MKKILSFIAASALVITAASCGEKTGKSPNTAKKKPTEATSQTVTTDTATSAATTAITTTAVSTTVTTTSASQADPLGGGAFSYNEDGAVVFEADQNNADDRTLIAAAQALFESACHTQMNFTASCPFEVDNSDIAENERGWQYSRITDSKIKTFSDLENEYFKVFSRRYPCNELSQLYFEKDGSVYAFCGGRGSNIFYSSSKVTEIKSKSDDEIVFSVDNFYDGNDFGEDSYTETDDFSVVIENGVWKAGKFTLPY
jgi:hypothetical protein